MGSTKLVWGPPFSVCVKLRSREVLVSVLGDPGRYPAPVGAQQGEFQGGKEEGC